MSDAYTVPTTPFDADALADLGFASTGDPRQSRSQTWLPPEDLRIDLSDAGQRRFGDYELIDVLGRGGMGVVYRARQRSLERDVALKLLAAGPAASDEFVARFRSEARNAARMQHPNIVEIYEIGQRDGLHFFSMRLVDGCTLAQQIGERGIGSVQSAARLLGTIAEAVDYAHRLGVLHLDLKPGNVLIDAQGNPLVADFGLARQLDGGSTAPIEEISGTPSYMAPEQARLRSHPLSKATDIYGLGAILYELLTGAPPFRGPTPRITLEQVIHQAPLPPRQLNRAIPADLEAICLKCLEKDPGQRYATAAELGDDLRRFLDGRPVSVHRLGVASRLRRWSQREPRLALASLLFVLSLLAGLAMTATQWRRAEFALAQAQAERASAELAALRTRQLSDLFAAAMPSQDDTAATRTAALAAVQWLMRELPGDDQAQAELLQGLTAALLKAEKRRTADKLLFLIHWHLGQTVRGKVVDQLAQAASVDHQLLAGMLAQTLPASPQRDRGDAILRRQVVERSEQRLPLLFAASLCSTAADGHCAVPEAAARLIESEPRNLLGYALQLRDLPPGAEREALLAVAARASVFDDGFGPILFGIRDAFALSGEAMPMALSRSASSIGMREDSRNVAAYLATWMLPWNEPIRALEAVCTRSSADWSATRQQQCLHFGQLLAESRGTNWANFQGWRLLRTLVPDTPLGQAMAQRERQRDWWREQGMWSLSRDPQLATPQFLRDLAEHGELEADLRRIDRLGIAREPPPDWQPARPPG